MAAVLIVYATRYGQTEKIAGRIAESLRKLGHTAEVHDVESNGEPLEPSRFQAVIVGAPVHAGSYPRPIVRFLREHRALLESVPSAFFSVSLAVLSRTSEGRAQTLAIVDKLVAEIGFRPPLVELFAGALVYSKYNFLVRFVMKRIVAKEGGDTDTSRDYEYTDWSEVERFASEISARIASSAPKPEHAPVEH